MRRRRSILLLSWALALGCSDSTGPARLNGVWVHDSGIPGSGLQFTLLTSGSAVSGIGDWAIETCCSGTVSVSGSIAANDVALDFVFSGGLAGVPPHPAHFTGRLTDDATLTGYIDNGSDAISPYTFRKTGPLPLD